MTLIEGGMHDYGACLVFEVRAGTPMSFSLIARIHVSFLSVLSHA